MSEIFYSIQGEGIDIGLPTVFVRLAGCNLHCEWCDTKYSWAMIKDIQVGIVASELEEILKYHRCNEVCFTGGEPLLQQEDLVNLIHQMIQHRPHMIFSVETNCTTKPIDELVDLIDLWTVSPKLPSSGETYDKEVMKAFMDLPIEEEVQWKFVIANQEDWDAFKEWYTNEWPKNTSGQVVVVQPAWTQNIATNNEYIVMLTNLIEKVMKETPEVRVIPQLHKMIWGPTRRGV